MTAIGDLYPIVLKDVETMDPALVEFVNGYHLHEPADQLSIACEIATYLVRGGCPCGRAACSKEHRIAAQPSSSVGDREFVRRAVQGSKTVSGAGRSFKTNSIVEGMFFAIIRCSLELSNVKRQHFICCCGTQRRNAEQGCPKCNEPFSGVRTRVEARPWLVAPQARAFVAVRRWGCGKKGYHRHYYLQNRCGDTEGPRVQHDPKEIHDACPLQSCDSFDKRHSQRGTWLWVPAGLHADNVGNVAARPATRGPDETFLSVFKLAAESAYDKVSAEAQRKIRKEFGTDMLNFAIAFFNTSDPWRTGNKKVDRKIRTVIKRILRNNGYGPEGDCS